MGPLQVLEDKYKAQGFHVLGFFSNDFGNQGGSNEQIEACTDTHAVDFQLFALDKVKNPSPRPVFDWLLAQSNPGPSTDIVPQWNFQKYLISRSGELVGVWTPAEWPGDDPNDAAQGEIAAAIEAELTQ